MIEEFLFEEVPYESKTFQRLRQNGEMPPKRRRVTWQAQPAPLLSARQYAEQEGERLTQQGIQRAALEQIRGSST